MAANGDPISRTSTSICNATSGLGKHSLEYFNVGGSTNAMDHLGVPDLNTTLVAETTNMFHRMNEEGSWNLLKLGSVDDVVKWKALTMNFVQ